MNLLNVPATHAQVSVSSTGDAFIQTAAAQVDSLCNSAANQIGPSLRQFATVSGAFVRRNAISARLQFEGMRNAVSAHLSIDAWRPTSAPTWIQKGVQGASQATRTQTLAVAQSMPVVNAVKSNLDRLTDAHPSLAASGF
jgi:hypothetical protein